MSPSSIASVQKYLAASFPGCDWTQEIWDQFGQRLARCDLTEEQARAVIGEYRWTQRNKSPVPSSLLAALKTAEQKPNLQHNGGEAPAYDENFPPITGYEADLHRRFRADPSDPIFAKLETRMKRFGSLDAFRSRWKQVETVMSRGGKAV